VADVEECAELIRLRKAVRVRSPVLAEDLRSRPSPPSPLAKMAPGPCTGPITALQLGLGGGPRGSSAPVCLAFPVHPLRGSTVANNGNATWRDQR
jgi:hypothetical protein